MSVSPVTLPEIRTGVELVLRWTVPEAATDSADRFTKHGRASRPGGRNRRFMVEFGAIVQSQDGWISTFASQHEVVCSIVVDYSLPPRYADETIAHDGSQIEQALYQALVRNEPLTTPDGDVTAEIQIIGVDGQGPTVLERDDHGGVKQVAHDYLLYFMKDRRY